jgi:hypothetical protein
MTNNDFRNGRLPDPPSLLPWKDFPMKSNEKKIITVDVDAAKQRIGTKLTSMRSKALNRIADAGVALTQKQIDLLSKLRDRAAQ